MNARHRVLHVALAALLLAGCHSVTPVQTIRIDMATNQPMATELECAQAGADVVIELHNINPFVYDVTLNAQTFSVFTTVPEAFTKWGALPTGVGSAAAPTPQIGKVESTATRAAKDARSDAITLANNAIKSLNAQQPGIEEKFKAFATARDDAGEHLLQLDGAVSSANELVSRPFLARDVAIRDFSAIVTGLVKPATASKGNLMAIAEKDVRGVRQAFEELRTAVELIVAMIERQRNTMEESEEADVRGTAPLLGVVADDYKRRLKREEDWYTAYTAAKPVGRYEAFGTAFEKVLSADFVARAAVQARKDYVKFTWSAKPRTTSLLGVPLTVSAIPEQSLEIPTCGGFKLDFSTGIMFSDLVNNTYRLRDTAIPRLPDTAAGRLKPDTIAGKQILQDPLDAASFGPGAMLHVYYRFPRYDGPIPTATFGVFTNNSSNIVYTLGLAATFNAFDSRFSLGFGRALGKVKRLVPPIQDGQVLKATELGTLNNDVTRDQYVLGWYLAVTWNLP